MTTRSASERRAEARTKQRAEFDTCPTNRVMERISDKWVALLFRILSGGPLRRGDLARALPGASPKVLTETLRRLERDGLLARAVLPGVPTRVEYALTPLGTQLLPLLDAITLWANTNAPHIDAARAAYDTRDCGNGPSS